MTRAATILGGLSAALAIAIVLAPLPATGQSSEPPRSRSDDGARARAEQASREAGATIIVGKLVTEVRGRSGDVVPWEIAVSGLIPMQLVEARLVSIRQREDGAIEEDVAAGAPPTATATLDDASRRFEVTAGIDGFVRGKITIPSGDRLFGCVGVDIRARTYDERLRSEEAGLAPGEARGALKVRVRFLARVEAWSGAATAARLADVAEIRPEIVDDRGAAVVRVTLENRGRTPLEVEAEGRLYAAGSTRASGTAFPLVPPGTAERLGERRMRARLLPGAVVGIQARLPDALAPGAYEVRCSLAADKERRSFSIPLVVAPGDFPAQSVAFGRSIGAVVVSPAQLELSFVSSGGRLVPLVLRNSGRQASEATFRIEPIGPTETAGRIEMRPPTLTLEPGVARRAALTLFGGANSRERTTYARLHVAVRSADGVVVETSLPVCIRGTRHVVSRVIISTPTAVALEPTPAFEVTVRAEGETHVPLEATLRVGGVDGTDVVEARAGYGAWLLPGEERVLRFALPHRMAPGDHLVTAGVRTDDASSSVASTTIWRAP